MNASDPSPSENRRDPPQVDGTEVVPPAGRYGGRPSAGSSGRTGSVRSSPVRSPRSGTLQRYRLGDARIAGLPPAIDGLRILLITDLHVGPFLSSMGLAAAFDRLSGLDFDLLLYGGDFATSRVEDVTPSIDALRGLGAVGIPLRMAYPHEVVLLRLRATIENERGRP